METRKIEQVKVYKLLLNRMTAPKIEYSEIVAVSTEKQKLIDWCESLKEPQVYHDGQRCKTFKKDSPLEWFNPCFSYDDDSRNFEHGIYWEWVQIEVWENLQILKV